MIHRNIILPSREQKNISIYILLVILVSFVITGCNDLNSSGTNPVEKEKSVEKIIENKSDENNSETNISLTINAVQGIVTRVVDGDTIELKNGQVIRLINVNTPESTNKKETYGKEASQFTKDTLLGRTVWLTKDIGETDRYGRLLRFVWLKKPDDLSEKEFRSSCFNALLVLKGYAMSYSYKPDITYSSFFKKFDREAYHNKVGLWQFGEYGTTKGDYASEKGSSLANDNPTPEIQNEPSSQTIVYFTPRGKSYHQTKGCSTLSRSKNILSGTMSEAKTDGHGDPCDLCYK
jgi:micrococcal nuclease